MEDDLSPQKIIFRFYRTEKRGSLLSNVVLVCEHFKSLLKEVKYERLETIQVEVYNLHAMIPQS